MDNTFQFIAIIFWLTVIAIAIYWFLKFYEKNDEEKEDHYSLGLKYIVESKKRKAIEYLKEAIRKDSNNVDAYVKLGNVLREEGAGKKAILVHKDLMLRADITPDDRYNVLQSLSEDMISLKQDTKAESFLEQMRSLYPNDEYSLIELLKLYENAKDFKKAIKLLELNKTIEVPDREIRLAMYHVIIGLEKVEQGKEKDARIIYKEALKINVKCEAAYILIGDSYWREDRKDESIEKWIEAATIIPEKAHFVFDRLEKGWFEKGEYYKLEEFFIGIMQKRPSDEKALLFLAEIKAKKGEYTDAIAICDEFLNQNESKAVEAHRLIYELKKNKLTDSTREIVTFLDKEYGNEFEIYTCSVCNYKADEPLGKCPKCANWGKYV